MFQRGVMMEEVVTEEEEMVAGMVVGMVAAEKVVAGMVAAEKVVVGAAAARGLGKRKRSTLHLDPEAAPSQPCRPC
jgi:hypothetical protein